jgi:hypothetical protein
VALFSLLAGALSGCWSFAARPPEFQPPLAVGGDRDAVLQVSEAGIPFGDGSLGAELVRSLASAKALGTVHYPVVPPDPPPLVIRVKATGEWDESYVLGVLSSVVSGYFVFPMPIMPYLQWYSATCRVEVIDAGTEMAAFVVESDTRFVFHAIFADARSYRTKVKDSVQRDLANGVARHVAELQLRGAPRPAP